MSVAVPKNNGRLWLTLLMFLFWLYIKDTRDYSMKNFMICNVLKLVTMSLLVTVALRSYSQTPYPSVNIASPNAASIARFADYPVNLHTGVPEIDIPIHVVSEGPLELPIGLSYHAAGLKVTELASSVRAGWALNAGGMVSRTVKGQPDEKVGYWNYSFFSHNGYSTYFMDESNKTDYRALALGQKDGEPDLFFFNFGQYSGKFYFREDQTVVLLPEGDIRVKPYFKNVPNTFGVWDYIQGFIITTPDGTKYYFGVTEVPNDEDPIERTGLKFNGDNTVFDPVISSWYLYKVESADSKFKIDLTYRAEKYAYYSYATSPCIPSCNASISLLKSFVYGVALDQIIYTNGTVTFVGSSLRQDVCDDNFDVNELPNQEAMVISEIKVESNASNYCTTFKLAHDYFVSNRALPNHYALTGTTFTSDKKRLKLNSVQQFNCTNGASQPAYVFKYYDENEVPRRLSFAQDHWGFYNGAESNDDLIPPVSDGVKSPLAIYGDDREAHWPQMRAGALRSITYPTGGGAEFIFGPNEVTTKQCQSEKQETGGFMVSAGMMTPNAEYGSPHVMDIESPTLYYYKVSSGSGGTGKFYIDNSEIATVGQYAIREDYVYLSPGNVLRAYASADNGSGVGVVVNIYPTTSTCVDIPKIVGGLRVEKIDQFGLGSTPHLQREFDYTKSNLYSVPVYIFKMRNELLATGILSIGENPFGCLYEQADGNIYATNYVSPVSVQPLQTTQGCHIGYGSVKEIFPDGGYTLNEFESSPVIPAGWYTLEDVSVKRINANTCTNGDPIYPALPPQHDFERGNYRSKSIYDKDQNKLSETLFFEEFQYNKIGVFGVITKVLPGDLPLPTHYDLKSARLLWQKQINKVFNPSNANEYVQTETLTEYNSSYHRMSTSEAQTTHDGTLENKYTYVPDLTGCNSECSACATPYNTQAADLRIAYINNVTAWMFGQDNCATFVGCDDNYDPCADIGDRKVCAWTDYQYRLNELRKEYTTCLKNCKSANEACLANGVASSNINVKTIYSLEQENQVGTPLESSTWRNNKVLKSSLFNYKIIDSQPLGIQLQNVFVTELASPSTTFTSIALNPSGVTKDQQYASIPEVTYSYSGGRITEQRTRDGLITSYIWGHGNTVPIVKAVGVDYVTLFAAYTADPANVRNHSTLSKAHITTYQLDPVVGIISLTDPNGQKQSYDYDYDKGGRLIRIKDHQGKILEQYEYKYQF
jgi:YD repeat-containing protein